MVQLGPFSLLILFACSAGGGLPLSLAGEETWSTHAVTLHQMNLGGTLFFEIPLWRYNSESGLRVQFSLRHEIVIRYDGAAQSQFSLPQLISYITPIGDDKWLWCKPGGQKLAFVFERGERIAGQGNYTLSRREPGQFTVVALDGSEYEYENFRLTRFRNLSGLFLSFVSVGGLITRIDETFDGHTREIVSISYEMGRPKKMRFEEGRGFVLEYSGPNSANLTQIVGMDDQVVYRFTYENTLLSSIECPRNYTSHLVWDSFADFRRSDHRHRAPVWLKADDTYHYNFRQEDIWTVMSAETANSGKEVLKYNRLTGVVERSNSK
jgi:hypothetical protein